MTPPIGVFIVSRNRLFADSLVSLLGKRDELRVVGVAPDAEQTLDGAEVLLFDAAGDGAENGSALARLRGACDRGAGCKAIVQTSSDPCRRCSTLWRRPKAAFVP